MANTASAVIRSDNGTPLTSPNGILGLTTLSAWWITLGIIPDRIEKGKPGQNGSLERLHADIAQEIEGKIPGGIAANQAALDAWRETYNAIRPNEAIGMKVPDEVYLADFLLGQMDMTSCCLVPLETLK